MFRAEAWRLYPRPVDAEVSIAADPKTSRSVAGCRGPKEIEIATLVRLKHVVTIEAHISARRQGSLVPASRGTGCEHSVVDQ